MTFETTIGASESLSVPSSTTRSSIPDPSSSLASSMDISSDSNEDWRRQSLSLSTPRLRGHEISSIDSEAHTAPERFREDDPALGIKDELRDKIFVGL